jgi:RNA polymerase sigma factor (sigma-70 family)
MEPLLQQQCFLPDTQVIANILAGDKNLFEVIIRRYNQRLFRIGMSFLNDASRTEDAMQNAYIKAYEHLDSFENKASFATWLTRIMLNECLAQKKKDQRINRIQQAETMTTMTTPAYLLINKEFGTVLENAIAELPEKYRLVFILRELEGLSVKQTGETLNIEEANVKVRLNRAKAMLKNSLKEYVNDDVYTFHLIRCNRITEKVMLYLKIK